ncbi:MAG: response regulator [Planctomycetes bacterium]|nr:response regulator [Planctomycetota bacterium]
MPLGFFKKLLGGEKKEKVGHAIIVDEDPAMRELLELRLGELNYSVTKTENPGQAITAIAKCAEVSIFVIDVSKQLDESVTLARAIRERGDTKQTPIIFVSGNFAQSDMDKISKGIYNSASVVKPFSAKKFQEVIGGLKKATSNRRKKTSGRMPSVKGSYSE